MGTKHKMRELQRSPKGQAQALRPPKRRYRQQRIVNLGPMVGELRRKLGPIALAVLLLFFMGVGMMDIRVSGFRACMLRRRAAFRDRDESALRRQRKAQTSGLLSAGAAGAPPASCPPKGVQDPAQPSVAPALA